MACSFEPSRQLSEMLVPLGRALPCHSAAPPLLGGRRYMLWGGGAPFRLSKNGDLVDCRGQNVRMLGAVPQILYELKMDSKWESSTVAVASCTDEPSWADECMRKFEIGGGFCIKDAIQVLEITKGNKQGHLRRISESTGVPLEQMLFFDNERWNCEQVAALGVSVSYCPDGVTSRVWERALSCFPSPGRIIEPR